MNLHLQDLVTRGVGLDLSLPLLGWAAQSGASKPSVLTKSSVCLLTVPWPFGLSKDFKISVASIQGWAGFTFIILTGKQSRVDFY